ncbi:MAG: GNAT family N-acetyltransferase [Candidatus Dormibacteria bacterium]
MPDGRLRRNAPSDPLALVRGAGLLDVNGIDSLYRAATDAARAPIDPGPATTGPALRVWYLVTRTLSSMLPLVYSEDSLYVYDDGGIRGFVQASARPGRGRRKVWQVVNLCLAPEQDPATAGSALLRYLALQAAEKGVQTLTVRIPVDEPLRALFHQEGFLDLATEHVYLGEAPAHPRPVAPAPGELRAARAGDLAGVHQLYLRTTPASVARVEAPTLGEWRAQYREQLASFGRARDDDRHFVVDAGQVVAWARLTRGSATRPHRLQLACDHQPPGLAEAVLSAMLARASGDLVGAIWCPVRHYDTSMIEAIRRHGFQALGSQVLMAREISARARLRHLELDRDPGLRPAFG